jgi:soluble lytic murein transglycosylase-like protein
MTSTRTAALLRVALKSIAGAVVALALTLATQAAPASASGKPSDGPCANRLCTKYEANTTSCWSLHGRAKVSRCFIKRAARHYRQPLSQAYYIAHRESRYNYKVTNSSSGAAGLYQFMPRTWSSTPYRKHSPYSPRWASLAAMWMWKHGGYSHWNA